MCRLHNSSDTSEPAQVTPAPPPAVDGRLGAMIVQGADGSVFDLSSPFTPSVMQYAAMVPANVTSVTLCMQPWQGACVWVR